MEWLYPKTAEKAREIQKKMAEKVLLKDFVGTPRYIAGMDISNTPFDPEQMIYASVVVLSYSTLEVVEIQNYAMKQTFPYVTGLLGFREAPALIQAYKQLSIQPDLIMVDGHGISHPRGLGIASHIGVLLDVPTLGVAKSILVGAPSANLPPDLGSQVPLEWKGKELGYLLRSKKRCAPLIVSAGHKITPERALHFVLQSLRKYRLPEPTRQAHLASNLFRKAERL